MWFFMTLACMSTAPSNSSEQHEAADESKQFLRSNEKTNLVAKNKPKHLRQWAFKNWNPDCTQKDLGIVIPQKSVQSIFDIRAKRPIFSVLIQSNTDLKNVEIFVFTPSDIHTVTEQSKGMILYDAGDIIFDLDSIRESGRRGDFLLMYGENLETEPSNAVQYSLNVLL